MRNFIKLNTIQKDHNLNNVYAVGDIGPGGAYHKYNIKRMDDDGTVLSKCIQFQEGPRKEETSIPGVLDVDLLEIVRHRLTSFQNGEFACDENAEALKYVTMALEALNLRVKNRASRGVLGKNEK